MILFYFSAEPGAAPFVRVPATAEGLRYAGYVCRYKRGARACYAIHPERDLTGPEDAAYREGFYQYPMHPGIPAGTERMIAGDWCVAPDGCDYWPGSRTPAPPNLP